jgi:hypothetical protein
MPSLLVQDTARYFAFSLLKPGVALTSDLAWALVQGGMTIALLVTGSKNVSWIIVAWGAGASAGAIVGCWRCGLVPIGSALTWLHSTKRYSGWQVGHARRPKHIGKVHWFSHNKLAVGHFSVSSGHQ